MEKNNKVEIYKGIIVRDSNFIKMRVGANQFKELIDEVERTGLSIPKIVSLTGKPCDKCKGIDVIFVDDDGNRMRVKRGIMSYRTIQNNGCNILSRKKK